MTKTYRNRVTGVTIIVPCALGGPDWEEVTEAKETKPVKETKPAAKAPAKAAPKKKTVKKGADA